VSLLSFNKQQREHGDLTYTGHLSKAFQMIINNSLPRLLHYNPSRYPFMVPLYNNNDNIVGLVKVCGESSWTNLCRLSNATMF
jgi:hypothetical protein